MVNITLYYNIIKLIQFTQHLSFLSNIQKRKQDPIISENDVKRILILSHKRSGSSIVGDILQQASKTFYSFEPLQYIKKQEYRESNELVDVALHLLRSLYKCDFKSIQKYIIWVERRDHEYMLH